jgi:hypothetical protein
MNLDDIVLVEPEEEEKSKPEEEKPEPTPAAHVAVGYLADLVSTGALETVNTVVQARGGPVVITLRRP